MNLTLLFLTAAFMQVSATGYSQFVTINLKNAPLTRVFSEIEKQTKYSFIYADRLLANTKPVTLHVSNEKFETVLALCFRDQPLTYDISEVYVVIRPKNPVPLTSVLDVDTIPRAHVTGKIVQNDSTQSPLSNVTVVNRTTGQGTSTDGNGVFSLLARKGDVLQLTHVGMETRRVTVENTNGFLTISMTREVIEEAAVTVVSTGFQSISPERATGSFTKVDNDLLNRAVSTNILDRLNGVVSGLLIHGKSSNQLNNLSVRGLSTILANRQPLIVLDNFEFTGEINHINPNDVESITILKDAASASIWGAKAGNGVIVITTKRGRYNAKPVFSFNSNVTIGEKPDLFSRPYMDVGDYIDLEKFLFERGFYDTRINSTRTRPALSPVVEVLLLLRNSQISQQEAENQINSLRQHDVRNDLSEHFFQKALNQQYSLNFSGGSSNQQYYVSVGWDQNRSTSVGNSIGRLTVNGNNTYALFDRKLEITTGIFYTQSNAKNNFHTPFYFYPYAQLVGQDGRALAVDRYRRGYIDTTGDGKLLDWNYRPFDELRLADNKARELDYKINLNLLFRFSKNFNVDIKYRYGSGTVQTSNHFSPQSYFARDLINSFTSIDRLSGNVLRPIPVGGILDLINTSYKSNHIRGLLNYNNSWKSIHSITGFVGGEIFDINTESASSRLYGYDDQHASSIPVDMGSSYRQYISGSLTKIPSSQGLQVLYDRFVSVFANFAYNYDSKYTVSLSGRKDASNLLGVEANQKWVPLWSAGLSWNIGEEDFYNSKSLPNLRFRITYGFNGNVDKTVSAYLIATRFAQNIYNNPTLEIRNPPNPRLRWEKTSMFNVAIDFATNNNRISGSIEFYKKSGSDLLGFATLPGSSGYTSFKGNTANMKGEGVDLTVKTINIDQSFKWTTTLLFSYTKDQITEYKVQPSNSSSYVSGGAFLVGKPVTAMYSYRWAGLDPQTGNPQGYLAKEVSQNYSAIINATSLDNVIYSGPAQPPFFGGLLNSFAYRNLKLSFNITYKLGHYFRRSSVNYFNLFSGADISGHADYSKRWKQPGDELLSSVPSMIYPANPTRDLFYQYSEELIERADNVRLQDIQMSYDIGKTNLNKGRGLNMTLYGYVSNLMIIWSANKRNLDPDSPDQKIAKFFSAGLKISF